jgi:hypothetical protein
MICSRKTLLRKLRLLAPAVAENAIVPAYTHVCFTGGRLLATNKRIAISVPLVSDFTGLIPARSLAGFLEASSAIAVELKCKSEGKALVTVGDAALELPMQPRENFRFEMPPQVRQHPLTTAFCTQWSTACNPSAATPQCPTNWASRWSRTGATFVCSPPTEPPSPLRG